MLRSKKNITVKFFFNHDMLKEQKHHLNSFTVNLLCFADSEFINKVVNL